MSLRPSTEHENRGISLHIVLSLTRHSRARGNPGLFCRISLDTRFRGYDGPGRPLRSHPLTSIFEGGHEGFRRVRFARRSVSEYLAQSTQRAQRNVIGQSPAKAPRRKVKRIRIPNLAYFAPLREEHPNPRVFGAQKICTSRANFEILQCKGRKKRIGIRSKGRVCTLPSGLDIDR